MEHGLAYGFMVLSLVLGFIGLLRGFGVIGGNDASNTPFGNISALWDGIVWLLPAISMAFLAWAFHANDHHRMRDPENLDAADETAWKNEHMAAGIMAIASIVFALLGILTGFHYLGHGDHQFDSMPWHLASIGCAILTNALHSVRHHQTVSDDVFIVTRVSEHDERLPDPALGSGRVSHGTVATNGHGDRSAAVQR
jgi:hypothetical protein